jgi:hypothetical protein
MFRTCIVNTDTNLVVNVIDYETEQTGVPPGFEHPLLCVPSETGMIGASYVDGAIVNPPAPVWPDEELLANCKMLASKLLFETDWTQLPDCPLLNKQEFIEWRAIIRNYALNPVVNPIFPPKPETVWN